MHSRARESTSTPSKRHRERSCAATRQDAPRLARPRRQVDVRDRAASITPAAPAPAQHTLTTVRRVGRFHGLTLPQETTQQIMIFWDTLASCSTSRGR